MGRAGAGSRPARARGRHASPQERGPGRAGPVRDEAAPSCLGTARSPAAQPSRRAGLARWLPSSPPQSNPGQSRHWRGRSRGENFPRLRLEPQHGLQGRAERYWKPVCLETRKWPRRGIPWEGLCGPPVWRDFWMCAHGGVCVLALWGGVCPEGSVGEFLWGGTVSGCVGQGRCGEAAGVGPWAQAYGVTQASPPHARRSPL